MGHAWVTEDGDFGTYGTSAKVPLNVHSDITSWGMGLNFGLRLHHHPYYLYAHTECSGESEHSLDNAKLTKSHVLAHCTMGCPPVREDNQRALASGLSYVKVDNPWYNYFIPPTSV